MLARRHLVLAPVSLLVALAFPALTNGCSGDSLVTGGDGGTEGSSAVPIEGGSGDGGVGGEACGPANVGGSNTSKVAVQAINDYAAAAAADRDALLASCKALATALDVTPAEQAAADGAADARARMKSWCSLAVKAIGATKAAVGGVVAIQAPVATCEDSIAEKGACQAKCDVGGTCDLKANPPKCTGGNLFLSCKGSCTSKVGGALKCVGACSGSCIGACTATGGVECTGKCTGTCSASGSGTGPQADGSCKGTCQGTCAAVVPGATCNGSCAGECSATCAGTPGAPVKCNGVCSGDFDLLTCNGGRLEGGCQVDARCDAQCDAIVVAKSVCPSGDVDVVISGASNTAAATKLRAAIVANFGAIMRLQAHADHMASLAASISGSASALSDITPACIPPLVAAATAATDDVQATAMASGNVIATAL